MNTFPDSFILALLSQGLHIMSSDREKAFGKNYKNDFATFLNNTTKVHDIILQNILIDYSTLLKHFPMFSK